MTTDLIERYRDTMGLTREGAIRRIGVLLEALTDANAKLEKAREALRLSIPALEFRLSVAESQDGKALSKRHLSFARATLAELEDGR